MIFSLIETSNENGLDPYRYLTWLYTETPRLSQSDPGWEPKLLSGFCQIDNVWRRMKS